MVVNLGERWGKICNAYGVNVIELKVEWGAVEVKILKWR